jgi:molybdopterin-synthase adenylyltransferase
MTKRKRQTTTIPDQPTISPTVATSTSPSPSPSPTSTPAAVSRRRVVVVGAGALGSHVLLFLRNLDVEFVVIDHDRVERRNTRSQMHAHNTIRRTKVESVSRLLAFLFEREVAPRPVRLEATNAETLLAGASLVIDCLDDPESRAIVQAHARQTATPLLHGALAAAGERYGRVVWDEAFEVERPPATAASLATACENGEDLPFIALTAAYLAEAARVYLTSGRRTGYEVYPDGALTTPTRGA